jgi:hypothetical protein
MLYSRAPAGLSFDMLQIGITEENILKPQSEKWVLYVNEGKGNKKNDSDMTRHRTRKDADDTRVM